MSKKVKRILSIFTLIILSLSLTCASIFLIRFTTHIKLKTSDFANGSVGVLGGYLESLLKVDMPFWGFGIGLGTNAGANLMGGYFV